MINVIGGLYYFCPVAGYVNSLACAFVNVFWGAGLAASCACDNVLHCLFFSTYAQGACAIQQSPFY